jgi:uncharacterized protein (TIGR03435 family)
MAWHGQVRYCRENKRRRLAEHTGSAERSTNMSIKSGKLTMIATKSSMSGLSYVLDVQLGRPVVDDTGLAGEFDFKLEWDTRLESESSGPSIFTALREQLGLRLNSTKGPVDLIVIDSIEKPSEN